MVTILPRADAPVYQTSRLPARFRSNGEGQDSFSSLLGPNGGDQDEVQRPIRPERAAAIRKSSKELEAQFTTQMFNCMYEGVETDPEFGGGHGEEMFRSFLMDEYGKQAQKRGTMGLAPQIEKQLLMAERG